MNRRAKEQEKFEIVVNNKLVKRYDNKHDKIKKCIKTTRTTHNFILSYRPVHK
jgi:diphthamide synthase subunit DPH2